MNILSQIAVLFAVCLGGQVISSLLPFPFPATVLGMILLLLLLCVGAIKSDKIKPCSQFLLANMAVLFVPSGVNILNHWDVFARNCIPLLIVSVATVPVVYCATAWAVRLCIRHMPKKEDRHA